MKKIRCGFSLFLIVIMLVTSVFGAYAAEETETGVGQETGIEEETGSEEQEEPVPTYTITWKNADGKVLKTDKDVPQGTMPVYDGTPTKKADAQYTYTFEKWDPEVVAVTDNATYTAVYTSEINTYTVTWKNWDGTVLETDEDVPYGTEPEYNGEEPTREADVQYTYAFDKWDKDISEVKKDVTYTAVFAGTLNKYNITWKNWDGTVLRTDSLEYGTVPVYDADDPVKESGPEDRNTYSFTDWDPMIDRVSGDAEYTAQFKAVSKYITVTFDPAGGTIVEGTADKIVDGIAVVEMEKIDGYAVIGGKAPQVVRENYTLDGWYNPANDTKIVENTGITKDTSLKARWNEVPHAVKFFYDGNSEEPIEVIQTSEAEWKISTENFPKDPVKEGYAFNGWVIKGTHTKVTVDTSFPQDTDVEATWVKTHIIKVIVGEHGTAIPAEDYVIRENSSRRFAFNPDDNYVLDKVLVNGEEVAVTGESYTFSNVTEDMTLEVFFTGKEFKIVASGELSPKGNVYVKLGESVTFTYNKNSVKYLYVDGERQTDITGSYTFENVDSVHTISVGTASAGGSSSGSSGSSGSSDSVGAGAKVSSTRTQKYSVNWFLDENNKWKIKDSYGNIVTNSWVCDNDVFENGLDIWYIVGKDGSLIAADLVRDKNGNYYSFETDPTSPKYGMMRNKTGYYKCGDTRIKLEISEQRDATYGRILNQDLINTLMQKCGVVEFLGGNENVVYTASF